MTKFDTTNIINIGSNTNIIKRNWTDFNGTQSDRTFVLIPKGTIAKVKMSINKGGYNDPEQNWTDDIATRNDKGSVYIDVKYVVLQGQFMRRSIWGRIGLHSEKSDRWAEMGHNFIKEILSSAHGLKLSDNSEKAQNLRTIKTLADLDGLEFLGLIDIETQSDGKEKNVINHAITADHKGYSVYMTRPTLITNTWTPQNSTGGTIGTGSTTNTTINRQW